MRQAVAEFGYAQILADVFGSESNAEGLSLLYQLTRYFAADIANLAFQIAYAGFARVRANDLGDCAVSENDLFFGKPGSLALFANEELLGDFHFFQFGVAMQSQHFHAVL